MNSDQFSLSKNEELLGSSLHTASPFLAEAWQSLADHKQSLAVPAVVLGLTMLPFAVRGGMVALGTLGTGEMVATQSLKTELSSLGARLAEQNVDARIAQYSLNTSPEAIAKSITERIASPSLELSATDKSASSVSITQGFSKLPEYEKAIPANLITPEDARALQNVSYKPGENIAQWVNVDGEYRSFMTHIPKDFDPSKPAPLVVALDGFLVRPGNPFAGMANANGMIEQSDKLGFVAIFPVPKPRYRDQVFSWNESDGATNFLGIRPYSDTNYIKQSMQKIMEDLPIDKSRVYGVGFSQGALQLHDVVSKSPAGTFKAIATIAGTTTDKLATPPAGTKLLVIHSEGDPTLPYSGGVGTIPKIFDKIGWSYARNSKPLDQVPNYLAANNMTAEPTIAHLPDLTIKTWNTPQGETIVQEMLLAGKYGHTFPGTTRDGPETFFSVLNGLAADRSILDGKTWITEKFFGLDSSVQDAGRKILAAS